MFPSMSLNHAVFAPPALTMLFFIVMPGIGLFEDDAAILEIGDFGFDVGDLPIGLARL